MKHYLGIDIGSSTIKTALLDEHSNIVQTKKLIHFGKTIETTIELLKTISKEYQNISILITGMNGDLFQNNYIQDIPAIHAGTTFLYPKAESVIEIGSQHSRYITNLSEKNQLKFSINEECAGGTGSFFEDQMQRLGFPIEEYSEKISSATSIPRLSGRCSVFAKTDIIHRQQEGVCMEDILLGLCYATIRNFKATNIKNLPIKKPIALCGGIVHNQGVVLTVKDIFEVTQEELLYDASAEFVQAIGTAIICKTTPTHLTILNIDDCMKILENRVDSVKTQTLKPLNQFSTKPTLSQLPTSHATIPSTSFHMGIDIGSTSTNFVLLNESLEVIHTQYLRTKGNPKQAVESGIAHIYKTFGENIKIKSVGVTGSGRYLIGNLIQADTIIDEITAQAKSAIHLFSDVDTVFEIGGQDSKYIQIQNQTIQNFQMNKICAAGTGSFLEEQAKRLNVAVEDFASYALKADAPISLGERCTVFIESNINDELTKGASRENILAGLSYSVIQNYVNKVVAHRPVGEKIVLQGGVCYNEAVVSAFRSIYGERIVVSPYFSVSGAYGSAVLSAEAIGNKPSTFTKIFQTIPQSTDVKNKNTNLSYYQKSKELFLNGYERPAKRTHPQDNNNKDKKVIGIPYALLVHKFFPMFRVFFEELGYEVLLSPETNEEIISLSQQYAQAETCYPVKLIYGHMAWLKKQDIDFIFMPSVITMKHEHSNLKYNYGCVYMQTAPKLVFDSMDFDVPLLNPMFLVDMKQDALATALIEVGTMLGHQKESCMQALKMGSMAIKKQMQQMEELGKQLLQTIDFDEKIFVIISRTYGIEDPILNMNIPEEFMKRGHKVITLAHIPGHSMNLSEEYENMFWPFGQHILTGAKMVANHPNLYAIYLNNHGCGPDAMMTHLFQNEMGDKPYFHLEVDEHFSKVGIITRIEAFLHSIAQRNNIRLDNNKNYFHDMPKKLIHMRKIVDTTKPIYIPNLFPYSQIIQKVWEQKGYAIHILEPTTQESLQTGKANCLTKEYLSFVGLLGDILSTNDCEQIFIPETEGSEIDGVYARVLHDILQKKSPHKTIKIVTRILETLVFQDDIDIESIFLCLLAGDILFHAPHHKRESLLQKIYEASANWSLDSLQTIAQTVDSQKADVSVIGDPYILYNSYLHQNFIQQLEHQEMIVERMMLSEYILFLWKYRCENEVQQEQVKNMEVFLSSIQNALGEHHYFSNLDSLHALSQAHLKHFKGGNGAYRFAKSHEVDKAVIEVSSLYENTQTILNLVHLEHKNPYLSLSFEGNHDHLAIEKLKTFLYYLS